MYYSDKLQALKEIFGADVRLGNDHLIVRGRRFPIVEDVIVLLDPCQYTPALKKRLDAGDGTGLSADFEDFADDIQFTFGEEWQKFSEMMPEHEAEFNLYFDLVDMASLKGRRVCDLGCGIGRWSYFLKEMCRELVLVDFSEAIFVARKNLKSSNTALFFMADLKRLPFADHFCDFLFCLGVLHHLPTNAIAEVRQLKRYAPRLLIYLYYALENKPGYYCLFLDFVTGVRGIVSKIRSPLFRSCFTWFATAFIYEPLIALGSVLPKKVSSKVPLYEGNCGKSFKRIKQDVYDRFFTRIEQRFSKAEIIELKRDFRDIRISEKIPYWHFLCQT